MTLALVPGRPPQGDAVVERYVVLDLGGFTDHHTHPMVDEKAAANTRAGVDLDASQPTRDVRSESRQPFQLPIPQAVSKPVKEARMKARVTGDDFPRAACSRVAVEHTPNVFPDRLEHRHLWW